ncbi:SUMO1 sentrin specific peptidase 8 [Ophidiomyces ophidiicola]|nr:SUMO1 sentrin specific peptidase 8 [Ophidiomyces ophidiicola]KAI2019213.1 SUMO1 sentrin specific peptidase 8 [Ophidiomyces ophidiicola]KAI2152295.1 SUMO1 sentrin specific peptidase 8 [Ophidiomyces ophidiicola]KAI2201712.1 SUMO1 sentrin specific peptidase 8 [Ophidiomyces ophidiicola]KAI2240459.1 SUMO1 sentrin specific peptidase 8 [Ophidiomyces ophidiicola]
MALFKLWKLIAKEYGADATQANPDDTYLTYNDINLTYEDVDTLKNDWLTDNVIAFWEEYLEREVIAQYKTTNIILLRPSMSYLLYQTPNPHTLQDALPDFTKASHIFLPINDCRSVTEAEGGTHWSLLLVSVVDNVAFHYDSLPPGNRNEALRVAQKVSIILDRGFRFVQLDDSPVQENSSDCGVYVCLTMRHLLISRLLKACTSQMVSMSLGGKKIDASAGRREMVRIIDRFRKKKSPYVPIFVFVLSLIVAVMLAAMPHSALFPSLHLLCKLLSGDSELTQKDIPEAFFKPTQIKVILLFYPTSRRYVAVSPRVYHLYIPRPLEFCEQHFWTSKSCFSQSHLLYEHELKQGRIPAAYYRGGTSRGLIFHTKHLPQSRSEWAPIFRGVMGSPDPNGRQLDGIGGGISSLSKICVVGPSSRPGVDVDFTFVQVGVKNSDLDYSGNCGNLSSAIGPFAVDSGIFLPDVQRGEATVRIFNTNTGKIINATFPVFDREAVAYGDFAIDGVAGTAAKIQLDFMNPGGSKTGKMLPTGQVVDCIDGVRATCVDVGNPSVFLSAEELGVDGTILPDDTQNVPGLLQRLESIRQKATMMMGMARSPGEVPASIPKIGFVSPPSSHSLLSGEKLDESSVDVVVRAISVGQPHRALPITTSLSLAAAAKIPGSIVNQYLRPGAEKKEELVIGHSSGKLVVGARIGDDGEVERATVYRTARRLMEGTVYWK